MAQINISIEDIDDGVNINFDLNPPLEEIDVKNQTKAQKIAAEIINLIASMGAEPINVE